MSDDKTPVPAENSEEQGDFERFVSPLIVYVLYLASCIFIVTSIVGVVFAYMADPKDELERNHYQYQIRTFWITCFYLLVGLALMILMVGFLIWVFGVVVFIVRSIKGLVLFDKKEMIRNPKTWIW